MHPRHPFAIGFMLAITMASPAFAQAANGALPVPSLRQAALFEAAKPAPLFDVASPALAQARPAATTATAGNAHQFGVGLRAARSSFDVGASVRYFFYGGPLGVQADVWRYGFSLLDHDWSAVQFNPSALYRFREQRFEGPVSLTPYAGAGLSFLHSNFDDDDFFFLGRDASSVGVLLYGGVELFFQQVPNLGVSGELMITSNDDDVSDSLGGATFAAAGHWYFW